MSSSSTARHRKRDGEVGEEEHGGDVTSRTSRLDVRARRAPGGGGSSTPAGSLVKRGLVLLFLLPVPLFLLYVETVSPDNYPLAYTLPDPPRLELNNELSKAERLFEGQIHAPEALAYRDGVLYTGTFDAKIVRIVDGRLETVVQLGQPLPCDTGDLPCSRPLDLKFNNDGELYVCDTYRGLLKVNVDTGEIKVLWPSSIPINSRPINFLNNLDITSDGLVYMTDSSVYQFHEYYKDLLDGRPTGRLLRYNPVHNTTEVLMEGLRFANGVQLSKDEDFVLVSDLLNARVMKYHLKGERAGQWKVFADNLPCFPDNLQLSLSGGFWIGAGVPRHDERFNFIDFIAPRPWIRKILSWLPFGKMLSWSLEGSILVELDAEGQVIRTLIDQDGQTVRASTDVIEVEGGVLYIGSYIESYIARLDKRTAQ